MDDTNHLYLPCLCTTEPMICERGGCIANQLLVGLDYQLIRQNPKIISGISDATTLLNPISTLAGLITFHGPDLLWTFGREMSPTILDHTMKIFGGSNYLQLAKTRSWKSLRRGRASGLLVGGHLASLINIGYAGYGPEFHGKDACQNKVDIFLGLLNHPFVVRRRCSSATASPLALV